MPVRVNTGRPAGRARPTNGSSMVASGKLLFGLPQPPPGYVQRPPGISLCMIVKNEEKFLPRCLQSVAGVVDEINIVDTGSTDGTIEIARSFGARVERREWRDDFAWARDEALDPRPGRRRGTQRGLARPRRRAEDRSGSFDRGMGALSQSRRRLQGDRRLFARPRTDLPQ